MHPVSDLGHVLKNRALPTPDDSPAKPPELGPIATVAGSVGGDLRRPIVRIEALSELETQTTPVMAVPEIAVAEDNDPGCLQDEIGPTRQSIGIGPVCNPSPSKLGLEKHLRTGAGPPVAPHGRRACC